MKDEQLVELAKSLDKGDLISANGLACIFIDFGRYYFATFHEDLEAIVVLDVLKVQITKFYLYSLHSLDVISRFGECIP